MEVVTKTTEEGRVMAARNHGRRFVYSVGAAALLLIVAGRPASGEGPPDEQGALLYRTSCLNCHGETGDGNGPMRDVLRIRPADLRALARDNGGEFPEKEVYEIIDGRELVEGHGTRRMPIWGLTFQELDRDTDQEQEVRRRISSLIRYLESIQRDGP